MKALERAIDAYFVAHPDYAESVRDYFRGVAMAFDPVPRSWEATFCESDGEAFLRDWEALFLDSCNVCEKSLIVHHGTVEPGHRPHSPGAEVVVFGGGDRNGSRRERESV